MYYNLPTIQDTEASCLDLLRNSLVRDIWLIQAFNYSLQRPLFDSKIVQSSASKRELPFNYSVLLKLIEPLYNMSNEQLMTNAYLQTCLLWDVQGLCSPSVLDLKSDDPFNAALNILCTDFRSDVKYPQWGRFKILIGKDERKEICPNFIVAKGGWCDEMKGTYDPTSCPKFQEYKQDPRNSPLCKNGIVFTGNYSQIGTNEVKIRELVGLKSNISIDFLQMDHVAILEYMHGQANQAKAEKQKKLSGVKQQETKIGNQIKKLEEKKAILSQKKQNLVRKINQFQQ